MTTRDDLRLAIPGVCQQLLNLPNDAATRAAFVELATPILQEAEAANIIVPGWRVVCDGTNNTPDISGGRLLADVYYTSDAVGYLLSLQVETDVRSTELPVEA